MSQPGIDAVRDEHMPFFPLHLHQMIEITARLHHRHSPRGLTDRDHAEPNNQPERAQRQ